MRSTTVRLGDALLERVRATNLDTRILLLLIALTLVRGILYALLSPPFDSPDEKGHYDYVASMYQSGGSSVIGKERHQPQLYYWLILPAFAGLAGRVSNIEVYALAASQVSLLSLLAVRLVSICMTAATVPLAYWTAKSIRPNDRFVYLGTATFVALVPAYGWVGASINNDNLARLLTSGMILLLVQSLAMAVSPGRVMGLFALIAAGILTKATTLPIAAMVPAILAAKGAWPLLARRRHLWIATFLGFVLIALFLAGPAGSLVLTPLAGFLRRWTTPGLLSADRLSRFVSNLDIWPFAYQFKSFWASFSNDSIQLPSPIYWILAALTCASLLGLSLRLIRFLRALTGQTRHQVNGQLAAQTILLVTLVVLEWLLSFGRFYGNEPLRPDQRIAGWEDDFALMQGRFLFPVMIPIGFLFVWGLQALVPPSMEKHATWILAIALLALDWLALAVLAIGGHSWQIWPA